jgi:hypothetical protein
MDLGANKIRIIAEEFEYVLFFGEKSMVNLHNLELTVRLVIKEISEMF